MPGRRDEGNNMTGPLKASGDKSSAIKIAESIEGWLTPFEAELLYNLAREATTEGVILEIGSWKGRSTVLLAAGSKAGKGDLVYAVDHHRGSAEHSTPLGKVNTEVEFRTNLERASCSETVVPLVMSSREAARLWSKRPAPIRLLWIDGAHDYSSVIEDIDLWNPFLVNRGAIAFHDFTHSPGVRRATRERIFCSRAFSEVRLHGSILLARKTSALRSFQILRNLLDYVLLTGINAVAYR
jgi:predicted O-methyltransferase YrrM